MRTEFPRASRQHQAAVWRQLFERQHPRVRGSMCAEFCAGLEQSGLTAGRFPSHASLSLRLQRACGWRIETVPGLIPVGDFFALLRERRFPATDWMRHQDNLTYTPEPDAFHDLFGHVPHLFQPKIAAFAQALAEQARGADAAALARLERVYWFTIEFGLVRDGGQLRGYGAGLASSVEELDRALRDPSVQRLRLRTALEAVPVIETDRQQEVYALLNSLSSLAEAGSLLANGRDEGTL